MLGSYYVQARTVSPAAVWASLSIGALVTAVLVVNNLRDLEGDPRTGSTRWLQRWGPQDPHSIPRAPDRDLHRAGSGRGPPCPPAARTVGGAHPSAGVPHVADRQRRNESGHPHTLRVTRDCAVASTVRPAPDSRVPSVGPTPVVSTAYTRADSAAVASSLMQDAMGRYAAVRPWSPCFFCSYPRLSRASVPRRR